MVAMTTPAMTTPCSRAAHGVGPRPPCGLSAASGCSSRYAGMEGDRVVLRSITAETGPWGLPNPV